MLQKISSVFVVYRHKTLTGSLDPTHAIGTDKPCTWNHSRPQEDRFNPENGIPKGQGNHALIPWTHQFLEPVQSMVSRTMCTSMKSHPQGRTLQCHRGT